MPHTTFYLTTVLRQVREQEEYVASSKARLQALALQGRVWGVNGGDTV